MSERETAILNRSDLKYLLIDSLKAYSEDVEYISGNNPYAFNLNKKTIYIFIHNLHESGRGRTNQDECRIQINRTNNFLAALNSGKPVLFFGYYADMKVFTAWNPFILTPRINRRKVISAYSRFTVQERAAANGISCYKDTDGQLVITFKPEYVGLYIENYEKIHQCDESILLSLIKASDSIPSIESAKHGDVTIDKQIFTVTHRRFKRDQLFVDTIYKAYHERCAICGLQLELVVAAHIIPHSHPQGTDDPVNGICLCELHHAAYDTGLIYFDGEYNVRVNRARIKYLEKIHRDGGLNKFLELQNETLCMPSSHIYRPSQDFINIANRIRGITG